MFLDTINLLPRRTRTTVEGKEPFEPPNLPGFPDSALDHDDVVAHPAQERG